MDGQQIQSDSAADSPTTTGTPTPVVARAQSHKMLLVAFILASLVLAVAVGLSAVLSVWIFWPTFVVADNYSFSSNLSTAQGMVTGFGILMALPVSVSK